MKNNTSYSKDMGTVGNKAKDKIIVGYTQGTYDVFHKGHLNLLENAKRQCDKLVVGINSDKLVQEYKQKTPIYCEQDRMAIVQALKCVDEVVLCDTLDKTGRCKDIKFKKIFIGSDWKGNERWAQTEKDLAALGAEVVYLPHTDGISSTIIRNKLNSMNNEIKLSIIIPVYNAEKYIDRLLRTLLANMQENVEVIVVDDCSTDRSYEIIKAIDHKQLKIYRNSENKGICFSRNIGLKKANGEYVAFCDDDDSVHEKMIADILEILTKNPDIDMLKFGRELVCLNSKNVQTYKEDTKMYVTGRLDSIDKYEEYYKVSRSKTLVNVWNGVYRKEIIEKNGIQFSEKMKFGGEDMDFSLNMYKHCNVIYFHPNILYTHYKRSDESTSKKFSRNKIWALIDILKKDVSLWHKGDLKNNEKRYWYIRNINSGLNRIMVEQVFHKKSDLTYRERKDIYEIFKEYVAIDYNTKGILKRLRKENKRQYVVTILLKLDLYILIDIFYRLAVRKINGA